MRRAALSVLIASIAVAFVGCSAKYVALKGTGLPNPPSERVKVYIGAFPVESVAVETVQRTPAGASKYRRAGELPTVKREYGISDLRPLIEKALFGEKIKILQALANAQDVENAPEVENPFVLADEEDAILRFTGKVTIRSQKIGFEFSDEISSIDVEVTARDLRSGINTMETSTSYAVKIPYDSDALKEALVYTVLGLMTQKSPF